MESSDNKIIMTEEIYNLYYKTLRKVIRSMIPIHDYSLLEDYIHDCMVYLTKQLAVDQTKTYNMSYLKQVAMKVCVDNIRKVSSNIKYYCLHCNHFYQRKEKAVNCHKDKNKAGTGFGVTYNETSLDTIMPFVGNDYADDATHIVTFSGGSPETIAEDRDFFKSMTNYLSEQEKTVLSMLMDNKKRKTIIETLHIGLNEFRKIKDKIRLAYYRASLK